MPTRIQHYRTTVGGREPPSNYLDEGELGIDIDEGKLYVGGDNNQTMLLSQKPYISLEVQAPENPKHGVVWFQTDTELLYFYDDTRPLDKWVRVSGSDVDGHQQYPFVVVDEGTTYIEASDTAARNAVGESNPGVGLYGGAFSIDADGAYLHTPLSLLEDLTGTSAHFSQQATLGVDPGTNSDNDRVPTTRWVNERIKDVNDPAKIFLTGKVAGAGNTGDTFWEKNTVSGAITVWGSYTGLVDLDSITAFFPTEAHFTDLSTVQVHCSIDRTETDGSGHPGDAWIPPSLHKGSLEAGRCTIVFSTTGGQRGDLDSCTCYWRVTGY